MLGNLCKTHRAACICGLGRSALLQILAIAPLLLRFAASHPIPIRSARFSLGFCRGSLENQLFCCAYPFVYTRILMAIERTLSIIKPDAVAKNVIGQIVSRFEGAGLKVVAARLAQLSRAEAEGFYAVHKARPFYKDLVDFMVSGPVFVQVLEGENAIAKNRELMGATDPKKADPGTIRADFADSIDANAVHGSDSPETAAVEVAFFFPQSQVFSR